MPKKVVFMRFFNNRPLVITVVIAVVLLVLMIAIPGGLNRGPVEAVGDAVNGGQSFISRGISSVGNFFSSIFSPSDLEKENAELRERVAQLERAEQERTELERKLEALSEQLDFTINNPDYKYLPASVIAKDPGYYFDVFTINVGHRQGVKVDDAVITPQGLVGRISEVGGNSSKVTAIIDSRSSVSCTIERTRDICVVNGGYQLSNESGLCEIEYLPLEKDLIVGDKVVTNSLGAALFPKGLTVGIVVQSGSADAATEASRRVLLEPAVDFLHLEEVMVVMQDKDPLEDLELERNTDQKVSPEPDETGTPNPDETTTPSNSATPFGENFDPFEDSGNDAGDGNGDDNEDEDPDNGDNP